MATAFKQPSWLEVCIVRGAREFFSIPVSLTPELAQELLDRNPSNRALNIERAKKYASDITAGNWSFNGEAIIISKDGRITNGQHRCKAVILAGQAILTAISFGVDYETRTTTDQLRPKHAGDFAGMKGISNAQGVAGIAVMALSLEAYGNLGNKREITAARILDYIEANQAELERAASYAHARVTKLKNMVSPGVVGFCHYLTRKINPIAADEYIAQIVTGEGLTAGDPAMVVRTRLVTMGKTGRQAKAELILHGWNAYRRGLKRTMVKVMGHIPELI